MKRLSDTLTYRGIASEAVFTEPPVVGEFGPPYYPYYQRQSARLSKITNDVLTRSGTMCFITVGVKGLSSGGINVEGPLGHLRQGPGLLQMFV